MTNKEIVGFTSEFSPEGSCIECNLDMRTFPLWTSSSVDYLPGFYCANQDCNNYGKVTVAIRKI